MTWLDRASQILDFTLFQLGGNPITVLHVVMSAVALVITHFLARSVRKVLHRYLLKELDDAPRYVIVRFTQYLVWIVGIAIALELLNVDLTALTVVAGAVGIGVGFGLQNVVNNLVSGIVLLFEQPVRYRDRVTVENIEGQVENINFRATTILTNDNISIIVPNSQFVNQTVVNWWASRPAFMARTTSGMAIRASVSTFPWE